MTDVQPLYHFTCSDHGLPGILESRGLLGRRHPMFPHLGPLVWLTDIAVPQSDEQLGLTSTFLSCDRQRWRFEVQSKAAVAWSILREKVNPGILIDLESLGQPEHWFVVRRPVLPSELIGPPVDMALAAS